MKKEIKTMLARASKHYKLDENSLKDLAVFHFLQTTKELPDLTLQDGLLTIQQVRQPWKFDRRN